MHGIKFHEYVMSCFFIKHLQRSINQNIMTHIAIIAGNYKNRFVMKLYKYTQESQVYVAGSDNTSMELSIPS